jgi:hypothetical protein
VLFKASARRGTQARGVVCGGQRVIDNDLPRVLRISLGRSIDDKCEDSDNRDKSHKAEDRSEQH